MCPQAIPLAVGDNYYGYRIVGTQTNLFEGTGLSSGRSFTAGYREALLGSFAAQKLRLKVGDSFQPYHGLIFNPEDQHEESYVVVGILEPSNTPSDRVIWIPLEGVQNMKGHDPNAAADISAVLVKLRTPIAGQRLDTLYNKRGDRLTFAWPIGTIMAQLFNKISWFDRVLAMVAYLVALVATGSILASIYNSMNERRRDFAICARSEHVGKRSFPRSFWNPPSSPPSGCSSPWESTFLITMLAAEVIRTQTGVVLHAFAWHPVLVIAPLAMIAAAALAGIIPALKAYQTDVASNLSPVS